MELAKITSKGQITIPIAIRRALDLQNGDKVMFIQNGSSVIMTKDSLDALGDVQAIFQGTVEEKDVHTESDDVVKRNSQYRDETSNAVSASL